MAKTVGDFFIERLHQWGVRRIYGYPGDGINGVFGALQERSSSFRRGMRRWPLPLAFRMDDQGQGQSI
jgi:pyruvate dehydrogenase (quinone)